jgi:adenylate cyclase
MRIDPEHAPAHLRFDGKDFWFCSLECAGLFAAAPERYASSISPND